MTIPKILVPFLPPSEDLAGKPDHVLSPALPFSPIHHHINTTTIIMDNPIIELSTEDTCSTKSDETSDDPPSIDQLEPTEQNAMVLHQHTHILAMYQPAHAITAGLDFSPPAEFLQEQFIEDLIEDEPTMSDPEPVEPNKMVTSEFIQCIPTEPIQEIFISPQIVQQDVPHFAMESTFRRSESDFKSKCMKMIRNAKGLVCKPESPKPVVSRAGVPVKPVAPRPVLKPIDTSFLPSEKKEEVCSTPIYLRHSTISQNTTKVDKKEPTTPYKSPVKGSVAYDIKVLCEQSFFGRW